MRFTRQALLALALSLSGLLAQASESPPVHDITLHNGLRVLIVEDHRAPVILQSLWVRVGSYDEPAGYSGVSHVLEHMLFKGTDNLGPGEFSKLLNRLGISHNAMTSHTFTAYYAEFERSKLPLMLELEADRFVNASFDPDEYASELNVVLEERKQRTDDNPQALAAERLNSVLRPGTGYAHPVIGWPADLEQLTLDKSREWYQRYYTPGNAVLILVGDLQKAQALPLIERFFGAIPAATSPQRVAGRLYPPSGERRVTIQVPVTVPSLQLAWNVPSVSTQRDDFFALLMLAEILDNSETSRLETQLVRQQQAALSVSARYDGFSLIDGLFRISATPAPGQTLDSLEQAIVSELQRLQDEPPSPTELARVIAQVISADVYAKDSLTNRAFSLGYLVSLGLPTDFDHQYVNAVQQVTSEQIRDAAQRLLTSNRLTVAHILPDSNNGADQ